ncbi:25S rRNA (uracil(2843)-N(3))-methyltransferase [Ascochyta lentis]
MPAPQKSRVTGIRNAKGKPSKSRQTKEQQPKVVEEKSFETRIPPETQQLILNIFRNSFHERLESDIQPLLQEVKGHLFDRNFKEAFGREDYLEAYAARWSPSRALGYLGVLWRMREILGLAAYAPSETEGEVEKSWKVVCLGGGAGAEIATLGGLQKLLSDEQQDQGRAKTMDVVAVDSADWTKVVQRLSEHITTPPPLSKYASAAVKAANMPLADPSAFKTTFHQYDVLTMDSKTLATVLDQADLITLMFTLNELYSASISLTQQFLLSMTEALKPGAMLLVVDSPGSYSTVSLNGADKNYPMQWLLDHTLLADASGGKAKEEVRRWEKVQEDDSRWFRLDDRLEYPIELENMRMQLHLYQRL